jgi:hypothetical protein
MSQSYCVEVVVSSASGNTPQPQHGRTLDASGHAVFSRGELGSVHVEAHRTLDEGRLEEGHRTLRAWLATHSGTGSDWVHLHFHAAIFELALDQWDAACNRFLDHILVAATTTDDALTDAPALLWRIALSAHRPVTLPWQPLRQRALLRIHQTQDTFIQIHNLLALAGAGDLVALEQWLARRTGVAESQTEPLSEKIALTLHALVRGAFKESAERLQTIRPQLPQIGGSKAQLQLFEQIEHYCWQRAFGPARADHYLQAA